MLNAKWQLDQLNDKYLGRLQDCLEDVFMTHDPFPEWMWYLHDEILREWDKRETVTLIRGNGAQS